MTERYLITKETRIQDLSDYGMRLRLRKEEPVVVVTRDELIELLPILNNYGNSNLSGRILPRSFATPISSEYARRLRRELAKPERVE